MTAEIAFRVGSFLLALASLGFGIPAVIGAAHFVRTGRFWLLWGFPSYDPAAFQRWGVSASPAALMIGFAVACGLGVVVAVLLWLPGTAVVAAAAGLVLLAVQSVCWARFVLPFGPPLGIPAAIVLVAGLIASRT